MNPSFKKDEHALTLDLYTRQPDMATVLATADYYRLAAGRAQDIVSRVGAVVAGWKTRAENSACPATRLPGQSICS